MRVLRFEAFTFDVEASELRKDGRPVKLQPQPTALLGLLLSRAGHIVSREEIQNALWPDGTVVDYDQSINFCIKRIREVLGDDTEKPRFVETVPRRGYRFVAPVATDSKPQFANRRWTILAARPAAIRGSGPAAAAAATRKSRWAPWLVAAAAFVLGGVAAMMRGREETLPIEQLSVPPPTGTSFVGFHPALSADGRQLAFIAEGGDGERPGLWIHDLTTGENRRLRDTGTGVEIRFSHGGQELLRAGQNIIASLSLRDGVQRILFGEGAGIWGLARANGRILTTPSTRSPLYIVQEGGEAAHAVTSLDREAGEISHRYPQFLPDGEHFIFLSVTQDIPKSAAYLGSVSEGKLEHLVDTTSPAIYADRHLFYVRDGILLAKPFDPRSLRLSGSTSRIVSKVDASPGFPANVAVSDSGVLAYAPPQSPTPSRLVWYDREGNVLEELGPPDHYRGVALSRDGGRVAATVSLNGIYDILLLDARGVATRATSSAMHDDEPVWAPTGDKLLFNTDRAGGHRELYVDDLTDDAPPQLFLPPEGRANPSDWDHEGRIWFSVQDESSDRDIWVWRDGAAEAFVSTEHNEFTPRVSPDGEWLAFVSNETGQLEVYVQPLALAGERRRLSHGGGVQPRWSANGRELFYMDREVNIMVANFDAAYTGREKARALFRPATTWDNGLVWGDTYAPTPDGQRFLVVERAAGAPTFNYTVLLNWRRAQEPR